MLLHNATCYTNPLLSRIYVSTTKLLNTKGALVATNVILRSLECTLNVLIIVAYYLKLQNAKLFNVHLIFYQPRSNWLIGQYKTLTSLLGKMV